MPVSLKDRYRQTADDLDSVNAFQIAADDFTPKAELMPSDEGTAGPSTSTTTPIDPVKPPTLKTTQPAPRPPAGITPPVSPEQAAVDNDDDNGMDGPVIKPKKPVLGEDDAIGRYQKFLGTAPLPPKSGVLKTLGTVLLANRFGEEGANRLMHPTYSVQKDHWDQQAANLGLQAKSELDTKTKESLIAERDEKVAAAEGSLLRNQQLREDYKRKTLEAEKIKRDQVTNAIFKGVIGGRKVIYGPKEDSTAPGGLQGYAPLPVSEPGLENYKAWVRQFDRIPKEWAADGLVAQDRVGTAVSPEENDALQKSHFELVKVREEAKNKRDPAARENPNQWYADAIDPDPDINGPAKQKLANLQKDRLAQMSAGAQKRYDIANPPSEPKEVNYWADSIQSDPKNLALIQGNKSLLRDVRTELSNRGANLHQIDAQTRDASEYARTALPHIDRINTLIDQLEDQGELGPIMSRWNDFVSGSVGTGPQFNRLRTNLGLFKTALGRIHGGARGGASEYMVEKFNKMLGEGKMDAATLRAGLDEAKDWVKGYAAMSPSIAEVRSSRGGATTSIQPPAASKERTINGVVYTSTKQNPKTKAWIGLNKQTNQWEPLPQPK